MSSTLDELMCFLIIRKHGKGIIKENDIYSWIFSKTIDESLICLYCNQKIEYGLFGVNRHALAHLKKHNLLPFL